MAKTLISIGIAETATIDMKISYHGWRFHYVDLLVLRCPGSYNFSHRLSRCGNPGMSPPPSSKGGLSPNDGSGFFSPVVHARAAFDPSPGAGSNREKRGSIRADLASSRRREPVPARDLDFFDRSRRFPL
ncbi:hypothetical protein ACS0ZG_12735 [Burkholderia gladioli]|uniref:hypothetical protein n=1 Tax=Burkholderia gladioli TaxID=28095 RepID=UPI001642187E|nr:hypothetical protein [Burkholderia gladioli]MDA0571215.1 hypothetical protein [Burkholderia gladioli]MDA0599201.1 hypothetical protein [Burkholderia gladioli]